MNLYADSSFIVASRVVRALRAGGNERNMKKASEQNDESEMRAEYDFSRGARRKYARRYAQGANVIVLEPDVAKCFPTRRR